jgi:hypothetical protein
VLNVATLSSTSHLFHTHDAHPMELVLDQAGEVDLVVADHGWAGAAAERGIDVVGLAASGGEGSGVERLHGGLIARDEGNMCVASGGGTYGKSEVIRAGDAKAKAVRGVTEQTIA